MKALFILLHLLGQKVVQGKPQFDSVRRKNCNDQKINVAKDKLDDVPSLAVLANNPSAYMQKAGNT